MALGWYLDGRVSAVVGTHTHVPTADETIRPGGTAYLDGRRDDGRLRGGHRLLQGTHHREVPAPDAPLVRDREEDIRLSGARRRSSTRRPGQGATGRSSVIRQVAGREVGLVSSSMTPGSRTLSAHRHHLQRGDQHPASASRASPSRTKSSWWIPSRPTGRWRSRAASSGASRISSASTSARRPRRTGRWIGEHPWVLIVDADERVTRRLAREIVALLERGAAANHYFDPARRTSSSTGSSGTPAGPPTRSCASSGAARRAIRTAACTPTSRPDGPAPTLERALLHYTFRSFDQYLEKLHRYAEWGAADAYRAGRRPGVVELAFRPLWRFFRMYVVQAGFLDGRHGLVLCALQAYGVFLKWAKVWEWRRFDQNGWRLRAARVR